MAAVTKAVIVAAGLGTRMLPATKAVPKELLAVVDKPLVQYAVEEAVAAGMTEIVFVIAEGKESLIEHFRRGGRVAEHARSRGDAAMLATVEGTAGGATIHHVYQDRPLGIAHAVACAREYVEGEPFGLFFPDDLILAEEPVIGQLALARERGGGGTVIAVQDVPRAEVSQYGVVDPEGAGNPLRIRGIVEKPPAATAPSTLAVVGRYILSETIFEHIDRIAPSGRGELEITDAIARQIAHGEPVAAYRYSGRRFDAGRPLGYLTGTIAAALNRPELREPLVRELRAMLATEGD